MAVELVERQESGGHSLSCPNLGPEIMDIDKGLVVFKGPDSSVKQETEKPYSIYTLSEKWFIVFLASLAALFR